MVLASRMQRARKARGLSLQEVADRMERPVTRAALSKYERGEMLPRPGVIVDLARVLGVSTSYLLEQEEASGPAVRWVAYRKHSRLGKREQTRIQARAEIAAEAFRKLTDLLHPGESHDFPERRSARDEDEVEQAAEGLRALWRCDAGPIEGLVQRIEDAGALVIGWRDGERFDALSGWSAASFPVLVINARRPADRLRFDLAHELGHLVLDTRGEEPRREEQIAHRFAAAFLVPREAAYRELGRNRSRLTVAELELLKHKYGVSMQAWTRRARELGIITEADYRGWQIWFRSRGLHVRETVEHEAEEEPKRLRLLAVQALAERLVEPEWVRSFCPEAVEEVELESRSSPVRELLQLPEEERKARLEQMAAEAAGDYRTDSEILEFLAFDAGEIEVEDAGTSDAPPR